MKKQDANNKKIISSGCAVRSMGGCFLIFLGCCIQKENLISRMLKSALGRLAVVLKPHQ